MFTEERASHSDIYMDVLFSRENILFYNSYRACEGRLLYNTQEAENKYKSSNHHKRLFQMIVFLVVFQIWLELS